LTHKLSKGYSRIDGPGFCAFKLVFFHDEIDFTEFRIFKIYNGINASR